LLAHVTGVIDGDTIDVLVEGRQVRVRLVEIDAPEKKQPYGKRSKESLSNLIFNKNVRIETKGSDRYGRTLGRIYLQDMNINAEQVRLGMAWVYDKYATDKSLYELQSKAKENKIGLWADIEPIPPWRWRRFKTN
jgi:endonuclease YncB( thermonuclease family)